jgi:spore coat polysaccharide biosynthesis protein SpsF (cytidylyltransferase family)
MVDGKTILITQARVGSSRLPGKVLMKIHGEELLKIHINRVRCSTLTDEVIIATTTGEDDEKIVQLSEKWGIRYSRGSVEDVLDRFYQSVKNFQPKWVVRVTSDCPLLDPKMIDAVISLARLNDVDYAANILDERFPDGQDVEVFKFSALERAWREAVLKSEREHVTLYIRNHSTYKGGKLFSSVNLPCFADFSKVRMTVDEQKDFDLVEKLIEYLGTDQDWLSYTNYIINNGLGQMNKDIIRNEGLLRSLKND